MAKIKVEKPRKVAKAPKITKPKALSQEFIEKSDDEDAPLDEDERLASGKTANKTNVKDLKSDIAPKEVKVEESSEDEVGSESDADEDDESMGDRKPAPPGKPDQVPAKVNGLKRSAGESEASQESSEEDSAANELPSPSPKKKSKTAPTLGKGRNEGVGRSVEEAGHPGTNAAQEQNAITSIPALPYNPPSGYTALDVTGMTSSAKILDGSLAGKQVWHITAPSNLSLSAITEVALDAIQTGKPVLSRDSTDYVLNEEEHPNDEHENVMVLASAGYTQAQQKVSKTLHLQQKISLPDLSKRQASHLTGSAAAGDVAQAAVSTVRPQPKGLRMRYKPFGFGAGTPGMIGSDSDDADGDGRDSAGPSFQFPKSLGAHGTSEKTNTPLSTKKTGKKRKDKPRDAIETGFIDSSPEISRTAAGLSHQEGTSTTIAATPAKKIVAPEIAPPADVIMTNGDTSHTPSKEEKAKRKEEKRLKREKKEAKLKAN